jgi:antitoxin component of RelBE/YafQ-DinJ toxin-antitoxin module
VPGDLKSVNIMVEIGRFKEFKELCEELGVTTSEGIRQLIEKEVEQKNQVGESIPIAVAYNRDDVARANNNKQTSIISFFAHCSTTKEVFHRLRDDLTNVTPEDMPELDRRYRNFAQGWQQYKANVIIR